MTIVTLQPEREYSPDDKDPLSLIEPLILFAAANEKSETLSKRLRDAWSEKRRQRKPMTKWTPAWLRLKDDRSGYELVPDKAKIVKEIVGLSLAGYGDLRILRKLNGEKWHVISGHRCWTNAYVSKILRTPALIGHYAPGIDIDGRHIPTGEVWEDYFPPVISKTDWYKLRAARQGHTKQRGPTGDQVANLFTGLLRNVRDGELYHRIIKNMPRLISAAYRNGLSEGDTVSFPYQPLENAFLYGMAHELKLNDLFAAEEQPVKEDVLANLPAELADTEHNMAVVKQRIVSQKDVTAFLDVLAQLDAKQKRLKAEVEQERTKKADRGVEAEALNDLQALAKLWGEKGGDKTHLRTKIKAKIRLLVAEMWMIVYGDKKSKFKTAQVQVFFKAGGSVIFCIVVEKNESISIELIHRSTDDGGRGDAVAPYCDFRLYRDEEKGKAVRSYVELMTQVHEGFVASRLKYPAKPARRRKTA